MKNLVSVRKTLQELDEEKKINFESEKSRKSVGMRLIMNNNDDPAQGKNPNIECETDSDIQILLEERVVVALPEERDYAEVDVADEEKENEENNDIKKGQAMNDQGIKETNRVGQTESMHGEQGNLSYIFEGEFSKDESADFLPPTPVNLRKEKVEVAPGDDPRATMFASAEDQELLQIGDNGMPQQSGEVDLERVFQGMSDWFINMVETTDGLNKAEILNDLKAVERDANGRIRPSFPTANDENRPLTPVLPTGGICTEPIYSSMRFMQIPLYETLPSSLKSYPVANEQELANQKSFFMKRTPTAFVGDKRVFLGKFDGRVQLHMFQEAGSHPWQCISLNMVELQRLLAQGPDILMDGMKMIIDDSVNAKLKPLDEKIKDYIEKRDRVVSIKERPEMCQSEKFEICELTIAHLDNLIKKQTAAIHDVHNWGKNARMQIDLNKKVVSLFENRLGDEVVTVRRMVE